MFDKNGCLQPHLRNKEADRASSHSVSTEQAVEPTGAPRGLKDSEPKRNQCWSAGDAGVEL